MCLLFLYLNDEESPEKYRLILANNRDEEWDRPTKPLAFWKENTDCISGVDLTPGKEGGTWLGASKSGKIGVLLNILGILDKQKKGRGHLVNGFISSKTNGEDYIEEIFHRNTCASDYNSFNLILIDLSSSKLSGTLCCNVNGNVSTHNVPNGILTCDNGPVDTPWQKSVQNRNRFEEIVKKHNYKQHKEKLIEELLGLLKDKTPFKDDKQLEKQAALTFMDEKTTLERSAAFVWTPKYRYGTRTHSIIIVTTDGECEFIEQTMKTPINEDNVEWETTSETFQMYKNNSNIQHSKI